MTSGTLRPSNWLQAIRSRGAGMARLLLLAFALQLVMPLLDLGGVAALAGEAALRADLQSSLCHDSSGDPSPDDNPGPLTQVKHCIFCLPMAGDSAAWITTPQAPIPAMSRTVTVILSDDQVPPAARPAFARSRAPPSSPRTV